MTNKHNVRILPRDRVMHAWENSMGMVRDYRYYADEIEDDGISGMFDRFAADEAAHAAELNKLLQDDSL